MNQYLQVYKDQRPSFFAGKKKKEEYRSRLNEITAQFVKLNDEDMEYRKQEKEINDKYSFVANEAESKYMKNRRTIKQKAFDSWKTGGNR